MKKRTCRAADAETEPKGVIHVITVFMNRNEREGEGDKESIPHVS